MDIVVRDLARRKIRKLSKRHRNIDVLLEDALRLYLAEPRSPILRLHKLSGGERWSISLRRDLRLVFVYWNGGIAIVDIGSHDEVY